MPQFIFTYHGGQQPETPEEGQKHMEEWKAWAASLGSALVNPGTPVGVTQLLTSNGVSDERASTPIMGFSILEAKDMDTALDMLKDNPHLTYGGRLEVSEMMEM